jgi:hypothetical protein
MTITEQMTVTPDKVNVLDARKQNFHFPQKPRQGDAGAYSRDRLPDTISHTRIETNSYREEALEIKPLIRVSSYWSSFWTSEEIVRRTIQVRRRDQAHV